MATVELKENEWEQFKNCEYAVIDCYGDRCTACVILEPTFDAVADELSAINFGRINITQYPEIADAFNVSAMPTLLYFRNGEIVDQSIGSIERDELLEYISALLYK